VLTRKKSYRCFSNKVVALLVLLLLIYCLPGCNKASNDIHNKKGGVPLAEGKPQVVLGDLGWDSIKVHNCIAAFIIEHGYDYPKPLYQSGVSFTLLQGLAKGDIDIFMEVWADNYGATWTKMLDDGNVKELGANYSAAIQGWYVPTYIIKGDVERGIEAVAPDLLSVTDLPLHWELFQDPEVPAKGRFYNSTTGWAVSKINEVKIKNYGLDKYFNIFAATGKAAEEHLFSAYQKGEPWLGYCREPSWAISNLNMTRLQEPAFDKSKWEDEDALACAFPESTILIAVNSELETLAPELVDFLENYETTLEHNSGILTYMMDYEGKMEASEAAAIYFLKGYPDVWQSWVPEDVAAKVEKALNELE
jgi:glycine betaine/proline transport system substrate-binding protein